MQVGQNVDLAMLLTVAGAVTEVQVEAVAPIVDSTKTDVSQVIGTRADSGPADQRPPRRLVRSAVARRWCRTAPSGWFRSAASPAATPS